MGRSVYWLKSKAYRFIDIVRENIGLAAYNVALVLLMLFGLWPLPARLELSISILAVYALYTIIFWKRISKRTIASEKKYDLQQVLLGFIDIVAIAIYMTTLESEYAPSVIAYVIPLLRVGRSNPFTYSIPMTISAWIAYLIPISVISGGISFVSITQLLATNIPILFIYAILTFAANRDWKKLRRRKVLQDAFRALNAKTPDDFLKDMLDLAKKYIGLNEYPIYTIYLINMESREYVAEYEIVKDQLRTLLDPRRPVPAKCFAAHLISPWDKEDPGKHLPTTLIIKSAKDAGRQGIVLDKDIESEMGLILRLTGRPIGIIDVRSRETNVFSSDDIDILQQLSEAIVLGYKKQVLTKIQEVLINERSQSKIYTEIFKLIMRLLPFRYGVLFAYSEQYKCMTLESDFGYERSIFQQSEKFLAEKTISGDLIKDGFICIKDYSVDQQGHNTGYPYLDLENEQPLKSYIGIRIDYKNRIVGALALVSDKPNIFVDNDRQILNEIAHHLGEALYYLADHYPKDRIALLSQIGLLSATSHDFDDFYRKLISALKSIIPSAHAAAVIEYNNSELKVVCSENWDPWIIPGTNISGGFIEHAAHNKKSIYLRDSSDKQTSYGAIYKSYRAQTRSELAVPIITRVDGVDEVKGIINIESDDVNGFSSSDISFLEAVAASIAVILTVKKLTDSFERLSKERQYKLDIIRKLGHDLEMIDRKNELLKRIASEARSIVKAEHAGVFLFDSKTSRLRRVAASGYDDADYDKWFSEEAYVPGDHITGFPMKDEPYGHSIHIPDPKNKDLRMEDIISVSHAARYKGYLKSKTIEHVMAVPLNGGDRTFGVIRVINKLFLSDDHNPQFDPNSGRLRLNTPGFSDEDLETLETISSQAAVAYARIRSVEKLSQFNEIIKAMASKLDIGEICNLVTRKLTGPEFGFKACFVRLRDQNGNLFPESISIVDSDGNSVPMNPTQRQDYTITLSSQHRSICRRVFEERKPFEESDVQSEPSDFLFKDLARIHHLRSYRCHPLMVGGEAIGTLGVLTGDLPYENKPAKKRVYKFSDNERKLLDGFCGQVALAAYNAESFKRIAAFVTVFDSVQKRETVLQAMQDILVGITAEGGLGFNRAIMFSYDKDHMVFREYWSIGQLSQEKWVQDIGRIRGLTLTKLLERSNEASDLHTHIKEFEVIPGVGETLFESVRREKRLIWRTGYNDADPGKGLAQKLFQRILPTGTTTLSFALIPMIVGDECLGILYVDNCFTPGAFVARPALDILRQFTDYAAGTMDKFPNIERQAAAKNLMTLIHAVRSPASTLYEMIDQLHETVGNMLISPSGTITVGNIQQVSWSLCLLTQRCVLLAKNPSRNDILTLSDDIKVNAMLIAIKEVFPLIDRGRIVLPEEASLTITGVILFIRIALEAIVENALKYSTPENKVNISVAEDNTSIAIIISDRGIGIKEEYLNKIFDLFFRIPEKNVQTIDGAGIGLSLAKLIIDLHGGEIKVESESGKGSTFTIILPRRQISDPGGINAK